MDKRLLIVLLAVVTVLAVAVPLGINRLIASRVRPPDDAELIAFGAAPEEGDGTAGEAEDGSGAEDRPADRTAERSGRPARKPSLNSFLNPIMDRSLFDSSKVGSTGVALGGGSGDDGEQEATDLGATLILTSVATDPRYSTALILLEQDDAFPEVYGVGDALSDATVEEIVRKRVYVRRGNGSLEYLEIGKAPEKTRSSRSGRDENDEDRRKSRRGRTDWSEGITKIDDTHYQVERSAIDKALGQLDRLSRDARVVPNYQDGKTNGFKIFSIKRNSAYKHLGLKNNDVLTGVNGMEIRDPKSAMDVYNKLQTESQISLEIIRKGEPMTIEYDIM